nr:hypothetical protein [Proteus vulgaris]
MNKTKGCLIANFATVPILSPRYILHSNFGFLYLIPFLHSDF